MHGAHVREFVARYRIGSTSMIQLTRISVGEAKARLWSDTRRSSRR